MTNEEKIFDILATISQHMNSMDARLSKLENEVLKTNIKLETVIEPKLEALGEGHAAILEQLVPCTRVDDLESRVKFLEAMLRQAFSELEKLKVAQ